MKYFTPEEASNTLPYVKRLVEDALHATKAALEEGILPGGGIALLNSAAQLTHAIPEDANEHTVTGYDIVINACEKPFQKILLNAGLDIEEINSIEVDIKDNGNEWEGYNPRIKEIVNMFDAGIIDPTKVTRLALENAASAAGMIILTECTMCDIKEKDEPQGMPMMG